MPRANPEPLNLNLAHIISLLLQKFNPLKAISDNFYSFLSPYNDLAKPIDKTFNYLPRSRKSGHNACLLIECSIGQHERVQLLHT